MCDCSNKKKKKDINIHITLPQKIIDKVSKSDTIIKKENTEINNKEDNNDIKL